MFLRLKSKADPSSERRPWAPSHNYFSRLIFLISAGIISLAYFLIIATADYQIYKQNRSTRFTHFTEKLFPFPAAVVNKDVTSLARFRQEVEARRVYARKHSLAFSQSDVEHLVEGQLINKSLYAQEIQRQHITITEKDVDTSMNDIYQKIGGQNKLSSFLADNYGTNISVSDFRSWIKESLVESAIQHQILTRVHIRHILIALPENPTDAQVSAAQQKAQQVKDKITNPSQFTDIAKQYSEDVASRDKGGELGTTVRGSDGPIYSKDFENTIFSIPLNTVSDPVRSPYGWHILIVDQRDGSVNKSLKDFTQDLRSTSKIRAFIGL
jgi:parvulin-like peptidyl-prolyl isomerase